MRDNDRSLIISHDLLLSLNQTESAVFKLWMHFQNGLKLISRSKSTFLC